MQFDTITTATGTFILTSAAGVVGWAIKRGLREQRPVVSKAEHGEPCSDLVAHKTQSADNWKEIFLRLANLDNTVKEVQQAMIRRLERDAKIDEQIFFLSSKMGWRPISEPTQIKSVPRGEILMLVVDDYVEAAAALVHMFEAEGLTVITAKNTEECLNALASAPFDFTLIDVYLDRNVENTNGFELASTIKDMYPNIETILYSGTEQTMVPANCKFFLKTRQGYDDLIRYIKTQSKKVRPRADA